jgi:hypothetical protein
LDRGGESRRDLPPDLYVATRLLCRDLSAWISILPRGFETHESNYDFLGFAECRVLPEGFASIRRDGSF